jgi:hypothetical protein
VTVVIKGGVFGRNSDRTTEFADERLSTPNPVASHVLCKQNK